MEIDFNFFVKLFIIIILFFLQKKTFNVIKKIDINKIKEVCDTNYERIKGEYYRQLKKEHNKNEIKELNLNISSELKVALCVIAKQENIYIREFINYYKKLGIKKIFLYDNNELEGEKFEGLLDLEIKSGFVEIINFRGFIKPQRKVYDDCYSINKNFFDWIGFYDVDEYLYIENFTNINQFLSLPQFNNCSSILINWKNFGDSENIKYEPKPLQKRFKIPFYFSKKNCHGIYLYSAAKSIIRGGLNIIWEHFPHFLKSSNICYPNGTKVVHPLSPPQYSTAYIKHYITKSTEEYAIKIIKGTANSNVILNKTSILDSIKNYYFLFNKLTIKKIRIFERILKFRIRKSLKHKF